MLNGTWQLKLLWMALGAALILTWVVTLFSHIGAESTLAATAGMLLGAVLLSVNVAALVEQLFGPSGSEQH